jgi:hypothetical protein
MKHRDEDEDEYQAKVIEDAARARCGSCVRCRRHGGRLSQETNCASRAVASALKVERGGLVLTLKLKDQNTG